MNTSILVILIGFVLIVITVIYQKIQDIKLLKTVTKRYRGTRTERLMVLKLLKSGIPYQTIFHDLYLKKQNGNYCQIDLVVATKVGIIVIEVKEFNGWIFGTEEQKNWTQILAYGKQKYRFYNPIFQNKKHIDDLREQLPQFQNVPFYSLIVFYGNYDFKTNITLPSNTFLVQPSESINVINEILDNNEPITYASKKEIVTLLTTAVLNGDNKEIKEKHIQNIKRIFG